MSKPVVAIVGRPNVGKSTLFNKLVGARLAIVDDKPGVTRDRIYGDCDWNGREFELVDTGGIEPNTDSEMLQFMRRQAELAIAAADVIVMVTDVKTGVTAADQDVANMLLRSRTPVCLAVHKCDSVGPTHPDVYEINALGLGDPIEVSAVHGHGTGDLLDWCVAHFPAPSEQEDEGEVINVAIIGKPNVGKSSLLNRILGQERVIVSNVAGTTRDAIDSYFENEFGKYRFIDTAAGDLGSSAARKFDSEASVPHQGRYRELTSTSNCTEYQARRLNIRERMEAGGTRPDSTLNGTLATTRRLVAIMENLLQ